MKHNTEINVSRLFTVVETVIEVVHEETGSVFGDQLEALVIARSRDGSEPAFTHGEVSEAVAFLVRLGILSTSTETFDDR